jgi:hypothetical protein
VKLTLCRPKTVFNVTAEFHSSSDKSLLYSTRANDAQWCVPKNRNIHQYNRCFAPAELFVDSQEVNSRLERKKLDAFIEPERHGRLLFRDIARNDDERSLLACFSPPGVTSSYDTPMAIPDFASRDNLNGKLLFYTGLFNAFVADFLIRPYLDKHVKGYVLNRVPWLTLTEKLISFIISRTLELSCIDNCYAPITNDICGGGFYFISHDERRFEIRCELDAVFFHLYGIDNEDDVDYIMETFPIVKRKDEKQYGTYRTKNRILEIYRDMARCTASGVAYKSALNPPPGPPCDEHGNFIPVEQWHTLDPVRISHIHRSKKEQEG